MSGSKRLSIRAGQVLARNTFRNVALRFTTAGFARRWSAPEKLPSSASSAIRTCSGTCGFALAYKGHDTRALQAYLGHKIANLALALLGPKAHDVSSSAKALSVGVGG